MANPLLKSMLTNFINEKNEQAELDLHNYLAKKMHMTEDEQAEFDDNGKSFVVDIYTLGDEPVNRRLGPPADPEFVDELIADLQRQFKLWQITQDKDKQGLKSLVIHTGDVAVDSEEVRAAVLSTELVPYEWGVEVIEL